MPPPSSSVIPATKRVIKALVSLNGAVHNYRASVINFLSLPVVQQLPAVPVRDSLSMIQDKESQLRKAYNRLHTYLEADIVEQGPYPTTTTTGTTISPSRSGRRNGLSPSYPTAWLTFVHNPSFIDLYTRTIFRPDLDLNSLIHITALVAAELRVPGWSAGEGRLHIAGVMWQRYKEAITQGHITISDTMIINAVRVCCEPRYMALKRLLDMYTKELDEVKKAKQNLPVPDTNEAKEKSPEKLRLERREAELRNKHKNLKEFIVRIVMEETELLPNDKEDATSAAEFYRANGLPELLNDTEDMTKLTNFTSQLNELIDRKRKTKLTEDSMTPSSLNPTKTSSSSNVKESSDNREDARSITIQVEFPQAKDSTTAENSAKTSESSTIPLTVKKMKKFRVRTSTANSSKKKSTGKSIPYVTMTGDSDEETEQETEQK